MTLPFTPTAGESEGGDFLSELVCLVAQVASRVCPLLEGDPFVRVAPSRSLHVRRPCLVEFGLVKVLVTGQCLARRRPAHHLAEDVPRGARDVPDVGDEDLGLSKFLDREEFLAARIA